MRLLVALLLAAACAAPAHAVAVPKSGGEQALNLAADVSLSATSVRALFADWLAKFKRVYREGDEVRRLLRATALLREAPGVVGAYDEQGRLVRRLIGLGTAEPRIVDIAAAH